MVLLNGVKYACERCIRGHRVSSCTHTDKPLTMIKPKGRPASQCPHCREQRKLKNTHSSCSCGKKGKPPGTHLASCLCHKNSHCTCSKDKKSTKKKSEYSPPAEPSGDLRRPDTLVEPPVYPQQNYVSQSQPVGSPSNSQISTNSQQHPHNNQNYHHHVASQQNSNSHSHSQQPASYSVDGYLYDDLSTRFDSSQGLLDYLVELEVLNGGQDMPVVPGFHHGTHYDSSLDSLSLLQDVGGASAQASLNLNLMTTAPSDAELDAMENMFPLFPLVGSASFEDDKSLPLLPIPDRHAETQARELASRKTLDTRAMMFAGGLASHTPQPDSRPSSSTAATTKDHNQPRTPILAPHLVRVLGASDTGAAASTLSFNPATPASALVHVFNAASRAGLQQHLLHIVTSPSFTNSAHNGVSSNAGLSTYHPHPLKASTSFTVGSTSKMKRPESVLSLASTSSNTSKQNFFEPQVTQLGFLKTPSSAAFPPFLLLGNNSVDDFNFTSYNSLSALFTELQPMGFLSDEDSGHSHGLSVGAGAGSVGVSASVDSVPTARHAPQQLRRTSSLSRSHPQLGHNVVAKDHAAVPHVLLHLSGLMLKTGLLVDNSPRLTSLRTPVPPQERSFFKPPSISGFVPEEDEDVQMGVVADSEQNSDWDGALDMRRSLGNGVAPDFQDYKSIPMFQDLFGGLEKRA